MSFPAPRRRRARTRGVSHEPKRRGELAEIAFLHKATNLGFSLAKPYGDSARYDFIVDASGRLSRVQVKSVTACHDNAYRISSGRGHSSKRAYTARDIDFLAAYVFPHDAWYIIPVADLHGVRTLSLAPHFPSRRRFEPFREAWALLADADPASRRIARALPDPRDCHPERAMPCSSLQGMASRRNLAFPSPLSGRKTVAHGVSRG